MNARKAATSADDLPTQLTRTNARLPPLAWLAVLVVGVGLFELLRHSLITSKNPNLVPALVLVGAAVIPVSFTLFILGRRVAFNVSGSTLSITAALGGLVGIVVASSVEYDTLRDLGTLPTIAVAVIEETAKMLIPIGLLVLTARRRQVIPVDGLLIGVASGAGFATLETMGYAFVALINSNGDLGAMDGVLVLRGLLSPAAHMAWTGINGAALWSAASAGWTPRSLVRLVTAFVLAVALHSAWDSIGTLAGYVSLATVGLAALIYAISRLRSQDTRQICRAPSPHLNRDVRDPRRRSADVSAATLCGAERPDSARRTGQDHPNNTNRREHRCGRRATRAIRCLRTWRPTSRSPSHLLAAVECFDWPCTDRRHRRGQSVLAMLPERASERKSRHDHSATSHAHSLTPPIPRFRDVQACPKDRGRPVHIADALTRTAIAACSVFGVREHSKRLRPHCQITCR